MATNSGKRALRVAGLAVLGAVTLAGCRAPMAPMGNGVAWGPGAFHSNGERIYFTGTSDTDTITYAGGPDVGTMMMGGRLSCASCHGVDGRGGQHVMHMRTMDAPDIRWQALSEHEQEEAQGASVDSGDEPADADHEYNLDTFRLAVTEGKHPDGEDLSADMPRWVMGDEDLADLAGYLKQLD